MDIDVSAPAPGVPSSTVSSPTPISPASSAPGAPPHDAPSKTPAIVALTAGGVLVIGGVVSYVLARGARDDHFATCAEQTTPTCSDDAGVSKVRLFEGVAFGAWGLGAVALTTGTVLLLRSSAPASSTTVGLAPTMGGVRFQLGGTF